ncbi:hypothetical protein RJT34_27512 [Clitoria ternatea]|uniref:Uncharacterized protein n=1 Tax=Clitoria ternatea TaxID=43366 RepID=A0AAN9I9S1_CLITE
MIFQWSFTLIIFNYGSSRRMLHQWLVIIKLIHLLCFAISENNSTNTLPRFYRYACNLDQSSVPPSTTYQTNLNNLIS